MICEITCPYCQGRHKVEFAIDDQWGIETCCEGCEKRFRIESLINGHYERDCALNNENHVLTAIRGKDGEGIVRYRCKKCDVLKFDSDAIPNSNLRSQIINFTGEILDA